MGKNLHHSGKSRLAGLLFILLILMVVSGGVLYRSEKAGIRAETFREFKTLAEAKRRELSRWYQGRLSETGTLSRGDPWQLKEHSLSQENKNKQKQTDEANGYLLAQTSTHNVYDKLNKQISFSAVGLLLLMVIASLLLALRHYCRQRNLYRELLKKSLELQQSQKRFGTILYSIGDGVITADKKGKVQYLNPVAERMTGWTEHEARDKAIEDIFHIIRESNRERIENPVNQVLREGKIVELTNYALLVTKDGREIPITDSGAPIRDDQQNLAGVVLVFSDRSKERAQRMQLIESEKKYRSLISQMQLGMAVHELILDQEGKPADYRFLEVNKQFEELTGLKQENIIGKTVLEVLPGTEQIWIERYGQVVLTGEPDSFENYSRELNRYYSIKAYCNRPNEFAVIVEDITPRVEAESRLKENERKYRRLAENMSDVIWTADLDLRTTYISPSVVRLLGERAEEHIKRTLEEKMPPQSIQLLKTVLEEELEREKEPDANPNRSRLLQLEHYRADGTLIWTGMHISFTRNSQGKISGFLGVTRNISELKKREQQLRDSEELSRLVMENNMYAVLLTRPDGSVLSANRAACEMFNMSEQEITKAGRNKMVVMDAGFQELHQHFMAKGKIQGAEVCCIRKDGSRFPAEVSSSIFYNGKGELFIGVILNDISERKKATQALRESEQNYRALIDGMNETVWVIGTDGQLIDVNKRAITATGYSKEELLKMGLQGL
ncbi:MAG: PAS domain S-box protein, partial [Mangrovibacterium sp.]